MTLFDLLFLAAVFATVGTLIAAAAALLRGRRSRALGILRKLGISAAAYLAIVAVVGLISPQRVLSVGDPWCFDDWCLSVEGVERTPAPPQVRYHVALRIFSRARRVSQRALGAWVYLIDERGHRYTPESDPSAVPLDVRLGPGESVATSRIFKVPADAWELSLITGHGSGWISKLVIADEGSLFHKRTFVRLR